MSILSRLTLTAAFSGLLLAGCADHPAIKSTSPSPSPSTATATTSRVTPTPTRSHREQPVHRSSTVTETAAGAGEAKTVTPPEDTGIASCDDYLSSYLACHRAANIYASDQLQSRYEAMRNSLLRDSQNPDIRPQLAARCNSLASQLRQALHGKSCASTPAPSSSAP